MKFLIIRTDNIGDLICTTPVMRAIRIKFPDAHIAAFVNSYNAAVLDNNPDVNAVYAYIKGKHRVGGLLTTYWHRLKLILKLRREKFDYAILAGAGVRHKGLQFARLCGAKHIIGYTEEHDSDSKYIDMGVPYIQAEAKHEVENTFKLLTRLDIQGEPPALRLIPTPCEVVKAQAKLSAALPDVTLAPIGVHISARKPSNRWPEQNYIELIKLLWAQYQRPIMLFWSPGSENNPLHPGDDEKAGRIVAALPNIPLFPYATLQLPELISGLSLCHSVVLSDGGALHVAAGLAKPIVCFFGNSIVKHWHPWGVKHIVLQPESLEASDVSVDETLAAYQRLVNE